MTEQDIKNFEILEKMYDKCIPIDEELKPLVFEHLRKPPMADIFENVVGDDLKKTWDIPTVFEESKDESWVLFKKYFKKALEKVNVSYQMYVDNKITIGKDTMKLFKGLIKFYKENVEVFHNEETHFIQIDRNAVKSKTDKEIEIFVQKASEKIGVKKPSKSNYQLVLSLNMADWLLCSGAQDFTSCVNLESEYGYWIGIPYTLGDKNRFFLYIKDKNAEKKEYAGITVDKFVARSFGFVGVGNELYLTRWYPTDPTNIFKNENISKVLSTITGFKFFDHREDSTFVSKYKAEPTPRIAGSISFQYLDNLRWYRDEGSNREEYRGRYTNFGPGNCITGFKKGGLPESLNKNIRLKGLLALEKRYSSFRYEDFICDCCNKIDKRSEGTGVNLPSGGLVFFCSECAQERLFTCVSCKSRGEKSKSFEFEGKTYCKKCFEQNFSACSCCSTTTSKKKLKGDNICPVCIEKQMGLKVVACTMSQEPLLKKNALVFTDKTQDKYFFINRQKLERFIAFKEIKKNVVECEYCKNVFDEELIIRDLDETNICEKCARKESDKQQLFLNFYKVG